jgi:phosphoglycerate dehydrogenase-like enzyme
MTTYLLQVEPLSTSDLAKLNKFDIQVVPASDVTNDSLSEITISYGWDPEIGERMLAESNSKLSWVQAKSAGVDYLPLDKFIEKNITLTNASGLKALPIAQSAIGYILHFSRGLSHYERQSSWQEYEDQYTIPELPTVIFGTGKIGQQIALYLKALGGTVYGVNTKGRPVAGFDRTFAISDYDETLVDAKVVINVLPGTEDTEHFFNKEFFNKLHNLYLYVNVGRGATTDENALLDAMTNTRVRYAALDVTELEPLPGDSPLWSNPAVLLTQHTTWVEATNPGRAGNLFSVFERNLPAFVNNEPLTVNIVDLTKGY